MDVDSALSEVPVNLLPLTDDTDFKTRETAIAYNAAGMDLTWNFVTCAGAFTQTAVTPTTGGDYDWAHQGGGIYTIEIPASGGASINNDTEGSGWFTGYCTGVLPWRGPTIGFRRAALNDLLIEGGTASTNLEDMFDGTGYAGGATRLQADLRQVVGQTVTDPGGAVAIGTNVAQVGSAMTLADDAITAAKVATGAIDADALASDAVDEILDEVVEGTTTVRQALRLIMAALLAKVSGCASNAPVFRDIGDTKNRITAVTDGYGNRTSVTLDGS